MDISSPATARSDRPRTFVLLDPTSVDGETSLDFLEPEDDHVALVVLLSGRASNSLREFALCEHVDLATAGWIYLDQVASRIASADRIVEEIVATGPDPVFELTRLVALHDTRRVALPSSLARLDPDSSRLLVDRLSGVIVGAHASASR